jgi:hypothetical protein
MVVAIGVFSACVMPHSTQPAIAQSAQPIWAYKGSPTVPVGSVACPNPQVATCGTSISMPDIIFSDQSHSVAAKLQNPVVLGLVGDPKGAKWTFSFDQYTETYDTTSEKNGDHIYIALQNKFNVNLGSVDVQFDRSKGPGRCGDQGVKSVSGVIPNLDITQIAQYVVNQSVITASTHNC